MNKSLKLLLDQKQEVEMPAAHETPVEEPKVVEDELTPTEKVIYNKYLDFDAVCNAVANCENASNSEDSVKNLPDIIIGSPRLFSRYILDLDWLLTLVAMRPSKTETCIDNILSIPKCAPWFLANFRSLIKFSNKFPAFKDKILTYALTQPAIYSQLIRFKSNVQMAFEQLPECETMVLDILAKDAVIFAKCVSNSLTFFLFLYRRNTHYSETFFLHLINNDTVYDAVVSCMGLHKVLIELPTESQDRVIDSLISSDARFQSQFPGFSFIYDFAKKYPDHPQYVEKLFAKGVSIPNYVRRQITHVNALFRLQEWNADHAQQIESMVVQDPEWVLQVITFTDDLKALCVNGQFERVITAFLTYFYLCPKSFNFHVDDASDLQAIIEIVPDQATKLTLYFQFYQLLFVKGFSLTLEARNATYRDAKTMTELTLAIDLNFKKGTLDKNLAKPLNDVVAQLLEITEEGTGQYEALNQLKTVLESNLSLNIAGLLAEKVSKDLRSDTKVEQPEEQTKDPFRPSPGRTNCE